MKQRRQVNRAMRDFITRPDDDAEDRLEDLERRVQIRRMDAEEGDDARPTNQSR